QRSSYLRTCSFSRHLPLPSSFFIAISHVALCHMNPTESMVQSASNGAVQILGKRLLSTFHTKSSHIPTGGSDERHLSHIDAAHSTGPSSGEPSGSAPRSRPVAFRKPVDYRQRG